jgi:hypothetical protein
LDGENNPPSLRPQLPLVSNDRAPEFKQRCRGLGISVITLHSYRYVWAECAKQWGDPERFSYEAQGHNSKATLLMRLLSCALPTPRPRA